MRPYCVVISKPWPVDPKREALGEQLAGLLVARGVHTLVIPELYHMRSGSEALSVLRGLENPLIFCSWLRPRAAYWTLHVMGVPTHRSAGANGNGSERPLVCLNLAEQCCADKWLPAIERHFAGAFPGGEGKLMRAAGVDAERWYPIIDYDRCVNCHECAEFCLFGVYGKRDDGAVIAENPDACKPGCPACSRVCPQQAIIFPLYSDDAAIAGSETDRIQPFDAATLARIQAHRAKSAPAPAGAPASVVRALTKACECNQKADGTDGAQAPKPGPGADDEAYFDQVIDGLVKE